VRVYLDTCVWFRPFDNPGDARVAAEAQAFWDIVDAVLDGRLQLVTSSTLRYEISLHRDRDERETVLLGLDLAVENILLTDAVLDRARELERLGLRTIDAQHVAAAEAGRVDYLVTCDDRFLRRSQRGALGVQIISPTDMEPRIR
jgi:predicted nucleic acid-binding protein